MRHAFRRTAALAIAALVLALTVSVASADGPGWETVAEFEGPVFGLNAGKGDSLVVAGPAGPTKLDPDEGDTQLIAELPNVADVIQTGRREYYLVTGEAERTSEDGPCPAMSFCRVKNGNVTLVADIFAWETDPDPNIGDPDQSEKEDPPQEDSISNPFDLVKFGRKFLVADAGGNSILVIDKNGRIDWVAVLPPEIQSTLPLKEAVGCSPPPEGAEFICELPPEIPADAVPTTVAVGRDGYIYAGELKGVPALPGTSRVWRIDRDARHAECGADSDDCTLVDTPPLTSIMEMEFKGNTAYVLELDEASWLAAEGGGGTPGGTVNACRASNGGGGNGDSDDEDNGNGETVTWTCEELVTGLPFPTAIAIQDDSIYVSLIHFFQGPFEVVELTNGNGNGGDEDEDD